MKKQVIAMLLLLAVTLPLAAAVEDGQVLYLGGTVPGLKAETVGKLDTTNATALVNQQLAVDIHNTLLATQRGMDVIAKAGNGPLIAQTTATLAAAERVMNHLDTMLASGAAKRVDTLTTNLAALSTELAHASTSLNSLLTQIQSGKGSLGKMASDSSLYVNLDSTLVSLNALLKDLRERPGRYLTVKVF